MAKAQGHTLSGVAEQSTKYAAGFPIEAETIAHPLPFAYESTGVDTQFRDLRDPDPRSRWIFAFHRPETPSDDDWGRDINPKTIEQNMKKDQTWKNIATSFGLTLFALVSLTTLLSCSFSYKEARERNTITAYQQFLDENKGKKDQEENIKKAKEKIKEIKEKRAKRRKAKERFLKKKRLARLRVKKLEEERKRLKKAQKAREKSVQNRLQKYHKDLTVETSFKDIRSLYTRTGRTYYEINRNRLYKRKTRDAYIQTAYGLKYKIRVSNGSKQHLLLNLVVYALTADCRREVVYYSCFMQNTTASVLPVLLLAGERRIINGFIKVKTFTSNNFVLLGGTAKIRNLHPLPSSAKNTIIAIRKNQFSLKKIDDLYKVLETKEKQQILRFLKMGHRVYFEHLRRKKKVTISLKIKGKYEKDFKTTYSVKFKNMSSLPKVVLWRVSGNSSLFYSYVRAKSTFSKDNLTAQKGVKPKFFIDSIFNAPNSQKPLTSKKIKSMLGKFEFLNSFKKIKVQKNTITLPNGAKIKNVTQIEFISTQWPYILKIENNTFPGITFLYLTRVRAWNSFPYPGGKERALKKMFAKGFRGPPPFIVQINTAVPNKPSYTWISK